jgi:hypothetical protein
MEKERRVLSLWNENVLWKRASKGTNAPYEKECASRFEFSSFVGVRQPLFLSQGLETPPLP